MTQCSMKLAMIVSALKMHRCLWIIINNLWIKKIAPPNSKKLSTPLHRIDFEQASSCFFPHSCVTFSCSAAGITEEPQSVTVVVGGKATFQCAGIGDYVVWNVNGEIYQEADQTEFVVTRETVSGIQYCNLTVPITSAENNGTTLQCIMTTFSPSSSVSSDNATLIVLPGKL